MSNTHISLWVHFRRPPVRSSSASITFLPSVLKLIRKADHQSVTVHEAENQDARRHEDIKQTNKPSDSGSNPSDLRMRHHSSVVFLSPPPNARPLHPSTAQCSGPSSVRSSLGNQGRLLCPRTRQAGRAGDGRPWEQLSGGAV